jgi:hypothetical protein
VKVIYDEKPAEFIGLYQDDHEDTMVVLRMPGYGLYVKVVHPSKVTLVSGEQLPLTGEGNGAA